MRLKTTITATIALIGILGGLHAASGQELWATRYTDPAGGSDAVFAIVLDAAGNATIAGSSGAPNLDYTTISYDPLGHTRWTDFLGGPGGGDDEALAEATDKNGNVYVTGYVYSGDTYGDDYVTIKYSPTGKILWSRRLNGKANGDDVAQAIAVDSSGNVYVTGYSYGGDPPKGTSNDWLTVKYDTNGNRLWERTYNGPGNGMDFANAIGLDSKGNIYVAGSSGTNYPGVASDYAVIKYSPTGNILWGRHFHWPGDGDNEVSYLAVDSQDSVILAGSVWGGATTSNGTSWDYGVIKYDKNGTRLWTQRYNGPGNDKDIVTGLSVSGAGDVYVTGGSPGKGTGLDFATLMYDTNGKLKWLQRWDDPDHLDDSPGYGSCTVDAAGNFYVTGYTTDTLTNTYFLTLKYDKTGALIWARKHEEPNISSFSDAGNAIALDSKGNIFVSGASNTNVSGYLTIKYSP